MIPKERRTQLFSATMTTKVAKLQRACLRDPVKVEVAQKYSTVDTLRQQYLFIPAKHKVCWRRCRESGRACTCASSAGDARVAFGLPVKPRVHVDATAEAWPCLPCLAPSRLVLQRCSQKVWAACHRSPPAAGPL